MKREELEHIIRASGEITNQYEFVIIGSQSILGPVPNPPDSFTVSMEVDIYPLQSPELAEKIDGAIGEGSHFHKTHGYYAQGVGPQTAVLPNDPPSLRHLRQKCRRNDRREHRQHFDTALLRKRARRHLRIRLQTDWPARSPAHHSLKKPQGQRVARVRHAK